MNDNENISDNVSSDLYFLRRRLRELAIHFKPSISEMDLDLFVSEIMRMVDNELMKIVYK